jgi:hypothetical protein
VKLDWEDAIKRACGKFIFLRSLKHWNLELWCSLPRHNFYYSSLAVRKDCHIRTFSSQKTVDFN